jgi:hypothetical protein
MEDLGELWEVRLTLRRTVRARQRDLLSTSPFFFLCGLEPVVNVSVVTVQQRCGDALSKLGDDAGSGEPPSLPAKRKKREVSFVELLMCVGIAFRIFCILIPWYESPPAHVKLPTYTHNHRVLTTNYGSPLGHLANGNVALFRSISPPYAKARTMNPGRFQMLFPI